jgi:hypothetical protein
VIGCTSFAVICFVDVASGHDNPFGFDFVSEMERVDEYNSRASGE